METLKRYTFQIVAMMVLSPLLLAGMRTTVTEIQVKTAPHDLPHLNVAAQQGHALELSQRGIASADAKDLRKEVYQAVKTSLPARYKTRAFEIARIIITEANHNQMDPFFLMAVIKTESSFNIKARGRHGEIGLMQIMPRTAKWLAPQAGLNPKHINLEDPATNIRLGAVYFASLRKTFEGATNRYIGAYNMGPKNVRKLVSAKIEPAIYPNKVMNNYKSFYRSIAKANPETMTAKKAKSIQKLETRNAKTRVGRG